MSVVASTEFREDMAFYQVDTISPWYSQQSYSALLHKLPCHSWSLTLPRGLFYTCWGLAAIAPGSTPVSSATVTWGAGSWWAFSLPWGSPGLGIPLWTTLERSAAYHAGTRVAHLGDCYWDHWSPSWILRPVTFLFLPIVWRPPLLFPDQAVCRGNTPKCFILLPRTTVFSFAKYAGIYYQFLKVINMLSVLHLHFLEGFLQTCCFTEPSKKDAVLRSKYEPCYLDDGFINFVRTEKEPKIIFFLDQVAYKNKSKLNLSYFNWWNETGVGRITSFKISM